MTTTNSTRESDPTFDPTPRTAMLQSDSSVMPQPYFYVSVIELPDNSSIVNLPQINQNSLTIEYSATEGNSSENTMQFLGVYPTDTTQDYVSAEITHKNGTKKTYTGTVKNHTPYKADPPVDYLIYQCRPVVIEYNNSGTYFLAAIVDIFETDVIGSASVASNLITVQLTPGAETTNKVTVITPITVVENTSTITQICLSGQSSSGFDYGIIIPAK